MPDEAPVVELLVAFGQELREAGLPVGTGDVMTCCSAIATLDPSDLADLYWAGRTTMVTRRDQIPVYDRVFRRFFLDERDAASDAETLKPTIRAATPAQSVHRDPRHRAGRVGRRGGGQPGADGLRHRGPPGQVVRGVHARGAGRPAPHHGADPPDATSSLHPADGTCSAPAPGPDMRRTVRETMRTHGEPAELFWRRRRQRMRPLVLILDISGSMADYSRNLLQFAYSTSRAAARVEVFCFGTRLTRITRALERRRADDALDQAAKAVFDWEGGTRIGDSLDAFVRGWGRRGTSRGAIVVICSDGLDRGDPAVLAGAMERLSRLSHRIVWMNPHKGDATDFRPSTLGMMVAAPHIDLLLSGHDLRSLEELAALLPELH